MNKTSLPPIKAISHCGNTLVLNPTDPEVLLFEPELKLTEFLLFADSLHLLWIDSQEEGIQNKVSLIRILQKNSDRIIHINPARDPINENKLSLRTAKNIIEQGLNVEPS